MLAGQALALPLTGWDPPPGVMVTEVAPVVLQFRVEHEPEATVAGLAVKLFITGGVAGGGGVGGGGAAATVTVTVRLTLPAELVAVSV